MSRRTFDSIIRELRSLRAAGSPIYAIHYACEDLLKAQDHSPAVSTFAFKEISTGDAQAFSVIDRPEKAEEYVIKSAFEFLQKESQSRIIHWNMRSADFGFQALENRFVLLFKNEPPLCLSNDHKIDLDDLVGQGYGEDFADHPRFKNLALLNGAHLRNFLDGKDEAERFSRGEHGAIRRSVVEKVSLIARLAGLTLDGTLETKRSGMRLEFADATIDSIRLITAVGDRLIHVRRQLARRHDARPTLEVKDEYDAQDLFHSVLRLFFDDIRREDWAPSYAGGASRIDFVLPRYRLAIELKHTRKSMTEKELGEQLVIDVAKYKSHPEVRHVVCLVFDPEGFLTNPRGIENDLSGQRDGTACTVQIYDR